MTIEQAIQDTTVNSTEEPAGGAGLVRAASVIAAGNVASRVLGLVRESTIAYLFGATGNVSAFRVAATLVQQLYDFIIGGMASGALVPVFSEYAAHRSREELWSVASLVLNALAIVLAFAVLVLELFAPQLIWIYGAGYDAALQETTVEMIRWALPAVFFLGLSGIITGLLYTLKRFTFPAFTTAAFNAGIIVVAVALSPFLGIKSLVVGIVVGSAFQVALQLPGLRDMRYRVAFDLAHPALKTVVTLYLPVIAGLAIAQVGVAIDRYLVSFTGVQSLAWMQDATVLIQFPLGLVATAISFAILPELSRASSVTQDFQSTLAFGIKLVLLLILPAAVGLFVLAHPISALVFERGAFTANDTYWTATALQYYLIGLPFAAIDQPLVFAFYARKDTLSPNLVAFAGVAIYLVVALSLVTTFGMVGLVIANSAQLSGHALIMLWLTRTRLRSFRGFGLVPFTFKVLASALIMGAIAALVQSRVQPIWAQVFVPAAVGGAVFIILLRLLRVREAEEIWEMAWARFRGSSSR